MDWSDKFKLFDVNIKAIRKAQKGSDLYGVLEKTAFWLSTIRPGKSTNENWFDAQDALAMSMVDESYTGQVPINSETPEQCFSRFMNLKAEEVGRLMYKVNRTFIPTCRPDLLYSEEPFDNWMGAQHRVAKNVAEVYVTLPYNRGLSFMREHVFHKANYPILSRGV